MSISEKGLIVSSGMSDPQVFAAEAVRALQGELHTAGPFQIAEHFGLPLELGEDIHYLLPHAFGPGGQGEAWLLREIAGHIRRFADRLADTEKAMKAYRAAAKKADRLLQAMAAGEVDDAAVHKALDRLYTLANKAEIRGNAAASDEAEALRAALRARLPVARDAGFAARQARNTAEIARLRTEAHDKRMAMDPVLRAYEDELKLTFQR